MSLRASRLSAQAADSGAEELSVPGKPYTISPAHVGRVRPTTYSPSLTGQKDRTRIVIDHPAMAHRQGACEPYIEMGQISL